MSIITQELFNNMDFDAQTTKLNDVTTATGITQPSVLIVFSNSDINAALYHLNKSLQAPFDSAGIATVLVQESIKEDFVGKLQQQFKAYTADKVQNNENFLKTLATAKKLNAQLITAEKQEDNVYSPTLVCDFTHEQLGSVITPPGIVTFHTFRTAKEAIVLVNKETLKFTSVSIWHENYSCAYELVAALNISIFFINCYQVPLTVLEKSIGQHQNYVHLDKCYHYETFQYDGLQRSIAFPIGSIFAN